MAQRLSVQQLETGVAVGSFVAGVISALVMGLPLIQFFLVALSSFVLGVQYVVPWNHERWDLRGVSAEARPFVRSILGYHRAARIALWVVFVTAAGTGVVSRYGPAWLETQVDAQMKRESPTTHPAFRMVWRVSCEHFVGLTKDNVGPLFLVITDDANRLEMVGPVLEELLAVAVSPVVGFATVLLALVILLLSFLPFFEMIGTQRYALKLLESGGEAG